MILNIRDMKKFLFSAASILLLLGSCSQNELEENVLSNDQNLVSATIEGQVDSRLAVEHDKSNNLFKLSWSTGDSFKVFDGSEGAIYKWSSENDFTASNTPTNPTYAVYPYADTNSPTILGSTVTMTLSAAPSVENVNLPMWAGAPTNNNYAFKHLAAALQFTLNDIPAGYNQLIVTASNAISGEFKAELDAEEPKLETTATTLTEPMKTVTVSFTAVNENTQNKVFYIPLPVGTYESLMVSVSKNGEGTKELKSWSDLEVKRGKMYYTTAIVDAATVAAVNDALANVGATPATVNLTAAIDASAGALNIPEAAKDVTLNFAQAPTTTESAPLVINQNETATSDEATGELNVTMPAGATNLYATINAPTTTVTLQDGSYSKVTATTATNTLVVGKGVTITNLIVVAGNVRIEGGKITTSITNANSKEIVYVIADPTDADTYKGLSDDVKASITKIECTSDIWVEVNTASGLYAASLGAKNIKLGADITITADKPVNSKNGQIYDLNEHKVVVADGTKDVFRIVEADAVVTIKNGTIDNQNGQNYALSIRADNVTLNMEDVTIPANSYDGSLHKNGNYTGSIVSLTNCDFNGVVYLSNTDDKTANTLNVSGGSFTSATQNCFELLNTNATIRGATLTNELKEQKYTANGNSGNSFSNPQGYCIAFTNNDGKAAKGSATLSGNTYRVTDENGSYIFNQMNGATLNMEVSRFKEFAEVAAAGGEIKLLEDIVDAVGLSINKNLTVDFNNKTYTISKPGAGSAGTQTLGFQLLKGNEITFKNGTIKCSDDNKDCTWESNATVKGIAMMIQNYANLTLEGMTIDGTNIAHNGSNTRYIVSFNSDVNLIGKTNITALDKDVAFDVCQYASYPAPVVNVETEGIIQGLVEVSGGTLNVKAGRFKNENGHCVKVVTGTANFSGGTFEAQEVAVFNMAGTVNITGGVFTSNDNAVISGNGTNDAKYQNGTINISGGTFNANITTEGFVACGIYHPQKGTLKVTGGTFNVKNGCGILMRGGSLNMTGSEATFSFTGNATEGTLGKVGDSQVVVPCGKKIVKDACSAYYDAKNIKIEGVNPGDIYDVQAK